jgi:UTP--glucose-1-phosphate uridylyltransferase
MVRKAVIPAAGLGSRFLPATKAQAKEMLPIVDTPVIQFVVEEAVRAGCTDILIITGAGKDSIEDHFDRNGALDALLRERGQAEMADRLNALPDLADFHFARQGEPRGLGHAVGVAEGHVGDEPFAVLLPDNIMVDPLLEPMLRVYDERGRSVIALQEVPVEETVHLGIADIGEESGPVVRIRDMIEKPAAGTAPSNLAAIGRYVLTPEIFEVIRSTAPGYGGEIQLTDAIRALAARQAVYGYVFDGVYYDTGRPLDYVKAIVELAADREDLREGFLAFLADFAVRRKLI